MKNWILAFFMLLAVGPLWAAEDGRYSKTIVVAQDGSGDYVTVGEALKKLRGDLE